MGIVRNQSIKNLISSYSGIALGAINTIILFPRVFNENPEYWGLIQLLLAYATVAATYTTFGTPRILVKYFPKTDEKGQLLFLNLLLPLVGFVAALISFFLVKEKLFEFIDAPNLLIENFHLVFILLILLSYFKVFDAISRINLDSVTPIFLRDVLLRIINMGLLLLYQFKFIDFTNFLYLYLCGYLLVLVIQVLVLIKNHKLKIDLSIKDLSIRKYVKFGAYIVMGGATGVLISKIDMMMIGKYIDLQNVAYYTVAFFVGSVIRTVGGALITIADPLIGKAWAKNDFQAIKQLYYKSSLNQLIVGSFVFLIIWLNIDSLFYFLPSKFAAGKYIVFFIGVANLFQLCTGVSTNIVVNSSYYKFDLYSNFILLGITVSTNMIFIPIYGINGAAFATALSILLVNLIRVLFIYWKMGMQPFNLKTFYTIIIIAISYFLVNMISSTDIHILDIIIRSTIVSLIFIFSIIKFSISEDINNFYFDILLKLKSILGSN